MVAEGAAAVAEAVVVAVALGWVAEEALAWAVAARGQVAACRGRHPRLAVRRRSVRRVRRVELRDLRAAFRGRRPEYRDRRRALVLVDLVEEPDRPPD